MNRIDNYITVRVPRELYVKWLNYVQDKLGVQRAGRYSKIGEVNSKVFIDAIKRDMNT